MDLANLSFYSLYGADANFSIFFSALRKSREIFVTPTYQSETERLDLGRRVTLTATYAFSFDRKVNASVEIRQVPGARESGILGMSR